MPARGGMPLSTDGNADHAKLASTLGHYRSAMDAGAVTSHIVTDHDHGISSHLKFCGLHAELGSAGYIDADTGDPGHGSIKLVVGRNGL